MSDWLSGIKLVFDSVGKLYRHWLERRNPIRAQAQRVLDVFAAHSVAPTQISHLLPEQFSIPMPDFASAGALKAHLTPALLDWVSEFFALNRSWLDGVSAEPHQFLCCYTNTHLILPSGWPSMNPENHSSLGYSSSSLPTGRSAPTATKTS